MPTGSASTRHKLPRGVIFNAYPDSIGKRLSDSVQLLSRSEFREAFSLFYILPTFFNSDLDRGFSIIDYNLNQELVSPENLEELQALKISFKLDLVLNHLSVNSPQFQDLLNHGNDSKYADFFIDWNRFWAGLGKADENGCIIPHSEYLEKQFMRKPSLPVMKVRFPDGSDRFFWNTFYQDTSFNGQKYHYRGQLDLNARSDKVWAFYDHTLRKLSGFGAKIIRLDAFAYLHKEPGRSNFFNRPETFGYLKRLSDMARKYNLTLLPEIHSEYGSGLHQEMASRGYPFYDFFFPGLVIHTLEQGSNIQLLTWIAEIKKKGFETINMLGCHDGIPVLDLKGKTNKTSYRPGLLNDKQIDAVVNLIVERGGLTKDLYDPEGRKIAYYQVNSTFFSALGEDKRKLRLARAIQLFMPGTPQVWYLDLFAGKNNPEAAKRSDPAAHKEINRTSLSPQDIEAGLKQPIVLDQLEMIRMRNSSPAFNGSLELSGNRDPHLLQLRWRNQGHMAILQANLLDYSFCIEDHHETGLQKVFSYS